MRKRPYRESSAEKEAAIKRSIARKENINRDLYSLDQHNVSPRAQLQRALGGAAAATKRRPVSLPKFSWDK